MTDLRNHPHFDEILAAFEGRIMLDLNSGCWVWNSALNHQGCFTMRPHGIKQQGAHRIAWRLYRGPIPIGAFVCHRCDVRACVNPNHLFLGDHLSNMADMVAKGRQDRGENHAKTTLTEQQALSIIRDHRSLKEISEELDISYQTAWRIKKGTRWKHLQSSGAGAG